ncbi:MAG: TldD/PmbA family protein [Defluviitaleaceae bacterium]|nr:TldD/PmbA family protein [Defluviitaleaceae bacterium]
MTFEAFKEEVFAQAKAKGFSDYELFYSAEDGFSVRVFKGEISEYKNSSTEGVGFRGTYEGKMGYAYSENMNIHCITPLLENAIGNATIIEDEDMEKLYTGDDKYPEVNNYNPALNDIDAAQKIQWALAMDKYVTDLDPRIKMADYCTVATTESRVAIANSHGLHLSKKMNFATAYVIVRAEENGETKSGTEIWIGRDFKDFDYKAVGQKAVDKAISYLNAEAIPTGEYPIIFNDETARDVFGVFSSIFMAEKGQKGFSMLTKEKLGEVIAASNITIRDDGVTDLNLFSSPFDAEGVATQNKAIIENGVLKQLLYNTKSAEKDGVQSTGNASKVGYGGAIETSCTNFYLVPGKKSYDELVTGLEKGLIITELAGLHSGTNDVSGDFSFSADGFLVEGGKIIKPVEQITIAGNFYEMLKNIDEVGSDLRFVKKIGMPSILTSGLRVAGL